MFALAGVGSSFDANHQAWKSRLWSEKR